jgi:hypothetical protein
VLGVETEFRIGNAVYPAHYEVGWHITGTAGVFGAAAAAGKLLGLDAQRMTWALGLAATRDLWRAASPPFAQLLPRILQRKSYALVAEEGRSPSVASAVAVARPRSIP